MCEDSSLRLARIPSPFACNIDLRVCGDSHTHTESSLQQRERRNEYVSAGRRWRHREWENDFEHWEERHEYIGDGARRCRHAKKTSFKNSIPRMLEMKYSSTQHMDTMCTLSHSANRSADQRTNEISASSCSLCVFCIVSLTQRTVDVCSFYPWICMIWSQPKLQPAATLFPLHHISHSHTNVFIGDFFSDLDLLFVYFILLCGAFIFIAHVVFNSFLFFFFFSPFFLLSFDAKFIRFIIHCTNLYSHLHPTLRARHAVQRFFKCSDRITRCFMFVFYSAHKNNFKICSPREWFRQNGNVANETCEW